MCYLHRTYDVLPTGKDGGGDIFLSIGNTLTIVQCKRYTAPVGVAIVRELYGVLLSLRADAAILASTGGFTRGVADFASDKPIQLLGLEQIIELHKSVGSNATNEIARVGWVERSATHRLN
ncbi:MAG: restriction endonuclease [Burkholderiales bacterium]|nr:restriction endonuclease [Burkholderiales bacterium]